MARKALLRGIMLPLALLLGSSPKASGFRASFTLGTQPLSRCSGAQPVRLSSGGPVVLEMRGGADSSWNLGRLIQTFTFFNGNPVAQRIPFLSSPSPSVPRAGMTEAETGGEISLWPFSSLSPEEFAGTWASLDDVVMGGLSRSEVFQAPHGATMRGFTSSRNNGGFCSARTRNVEPAWDVSEFSEIAVQVRCQQGMRYKLCLRDEPGWDAVTWCRSFDTSPGLWQEVRFPFSEFRPVVRGKTLAGSAGGSKEMKKSSLFSVQMMLSKYEYDGQLNPNFKEGDFELEFGAIRAIR